MTSYINNKSYQEVKLRASFYEKKNEADLTLASYLVIGDLNKLGRKPSVPPPALPLMPLPPKTSNEAYSKGFEAFEKGGYSNAGYYLTIAITNDEKQMDKRYDDAILILAQLYSKGLGIEKDIKTAESYYQTIINKTRNIIPKNLTKAYFKLALLYLKEFQDDFQARRNFRYAADRGHKEAQYQYAKMCYNGKGGLKDFKDAVEYYNKAAQQGHKEAQEWLKIYL